MGSWLLSVMGISLGMTIVLELVFAYAFGIHDRKSLLLVSLVNVLTNPAVVLVYYLEVYYTAWNHTLVKIPLEILAVFAEAYFYKAYGAKFRHPLWFSLGANLFSFGAGLIISAVI